ncbi:putative cytochrome P450, partial [Meredithblackwellia eburnea MCA 4105]
LNPLYDVPGPPNESILFGNLKKIFKAEPGAAHKEWSRKYGEGGVVRYQAMFGEHRLFFTDPVALNHVLLTHAYEYPKPNEVRGNLSRILGKGILFAEGDDHRRQKRILTPAFSPSALRNLTPLFFEHAYKLRDIWVDKVNSGEDSRKEDNETVIEVSKWLSRVTLDIIGLAGFGYNFSSLDGQNTALGDAFSVMLQTNISEPSPSSVLVLRTLGILITKFPAIFKKFPNKRITAVRQGFETMDKETRKIVEEKKRELREGGSGDGGAAGGKDLISLLLKANSADAKSQLSDAELQGQMTTFCLAGHETTSTALTWALWVLALHPNVQDRLRTEIRAARSKAKEEGRDELESDELNSLEYLEAFTRELLRFESPVSATLREAAHDDLIPLSAPIKSRSGATMTSIPVKKGQVVFFSITAANFNKQVFGEDADEFRPERWLDGKVGEKVGAAGVYSHLLTFLAGPRACIGYRFSILELKAILVVLLDSFAFAEREPGLAIRRRSALVTRPLVIGEEKELRHAMPLRVSIAKA